MRSLNLNNPNKEPVEAIILKKGNFGDNTYPFNQQKTTLIIFLYWSQQHKLLLIISLDSEGF